MPDQRKIVFLDGSDRAWDPEDAARSLHRNGFKVQLLDVTNWPDLEITTAMHTLGGVAWPLAYTTGEPARRPLFDILHAGRVPYIGSRGTLALCRSKAHLYRTLRVLGLPVLPSVAVDNHTPLSAIRSRLTFPVVAKPEYGTGSHGLTVIDSDAQLADAVHVIQHSQRQRVVLQNWGRKREYTCAVMRTDDTYVVAALEIELANKRVFDEEAKVAYEGVTLLEVDPQREADLAALILPFWTSARGGAYGRVDVLENDGVFYITDVNLLPALDNNDQVKSLFPRAIELATGNGYDSIITNLVHTAAMDMTRNRDRMPRSEAHSLP